MKEPLVILDYHYSVSRCLAKENEVNTRFQIGRIAIIKHSIDMIKRLCPDVFVRMGQERMISNTQKTIKKITIGGRKKLPFGQMEEFQYGFDG